MATSFQHNVDTENPGGVMAGKRGQMLSAGPRRGLGKVFSSNENSLVTPHRKALGDLSNNKASRQPLGSLSNTIHKTNQGSGLIKKPLGSQLKTPGPGIKVFGEGPALKGIESKKRAPKVKPEIKKSLASNPKPTFTFPDIENMKIFKDDDRTFNRLPAEDCLSSHLDRLGTMKTTLFRYPVRDVDDINPDFSHLSLDKIIRPSLSDDDLLIPPSSTPMECLDLPPVESIDFLDINNLIFD
ncbi:uncharacterized protein LOC129273543 [Lytechinus pictus]|uniref:uncharacterized protein LOC129273543 n=1 Tax=Lytechinus pictus TaxID=7653 RepID=UPI0030B9D716